MKKYKVLDLFSGAGGLTLGFVQNNFKIMASVDNFQSAVDTYNLNFNKSEKIKDITDPKVKQHIIDNHKNKIDLIIGGFPCQGFSMAGKRSSKDERNKLYLHTIEMIKNIEPNVFVLENVKGILSFKDEDEILIIDKIISMLKEIGYYSKFILLDSSKFGVPQKRERVIFIGSKYKNKEKVDSVINDLANYSEKIRTVRDAIEKFEDYPENNNFSHIFTKHGEEIIKKLSNLKEGESLYKEYSDAWKRIYYDKPSPTVKENHGGVHVHPVQNRVLTPRELASLQSFPDNFYFLGTKSNILKQIGNAVPVKMANKIAELVKKGLLNE